MSYFVVYFLVDIQVSLTPGYCDYLLWTTSHSIFHVFVSIKVFWVAAEVESLYGRWCKLTIIVYAVIILNVQSHSRDIKIPLLPPPHQHLVQQNLGVEDLALFLAGQARDTEHSFSFLYLWSLVAGEETANALNANFHSIFYFYELCIHTVSGFSYQILLSIPAYAQAFPLLLWLILVGCDTSLNIVWSFTKQKPNLI